MHEILFGLSTAAALAVTTTNYPAPKNVGDPATLGRGIERTMTLLARSTPQHRHTVKVLFYGQSITEQNWVPLVAADLRQRYPHANLIIENRALGGFSSQRLVHTAEADLYPFYPDLMIFYVYGSHTDYEDIIRRTRERTTAEILIQTDHANYDASLREETDPAKLAPEAKLWPSFMNYKFLPGLAQTYACGLVDQRNLWKQYFRDFNLPAQTLLKDGVHLNDHGCYLMAELVKAYLVPRPDTNLDPLNCDTVKTYVVGRDVQWQDGKLVLDFDGNRVDLIVKPGQAAPAPVRIDGRKPSEFPELYGFTRALPTPGGKWPVPLKIGANNLPQLEEWTMTVTKAETGFTFRLRGSKTGLDGEGRSDQQFVSNSGRVVIAPADWDVAYSLGLAQVKPVPEQFEVRWQTVAHFADEFVSPGVTDASWETTLTVAQGLRNTRHRLEITGNEQTPVAAVRVYRPPRR